MSRSMYDVCEEFESQRMKADLILRVFWSKDTTELDTMNEEIMKITNARFKNMSARFQALSHRTISDKARLAKHAYLLFGLYLTPEYAKTLVQPTPRVDPTKFSLFYAKHLPTLCNNLLTGKYTSMAEFVEDARSTYILL